MCESQILAILVFLEINARKVMEHVDGSHILKVTLGPVVSLVVPTKVLGLDLTFRIMFAEYKVLKLQTFAVLSPKDPEPIWENSRRRIEQIQM